VVVKCALSISQYSFLAAHQHSKANVLKIEVMSFLHLYVNAHAVFRFGPSELLFSVMSEGFNDATAL